MGVERHPLMTLHKMFLRKPPLAHLPAEERPVEGSSGAGERLKSCEGDFQPAGGPRAPTWMLKLKEPPLPWADSPATSPPAHLVAGSGAQM